MNTGLQRITYTTRHALHGIAATRLIEQANAAGLPPHALMQRAGLSTAKLALAIAPNARTIWIACGPGNNGGDGLEAAMHLKNWGKNPVVTWLGDAARAPPDAAASCKNAQAAGVEFANEPPAHFDLCLDALFGIGASTAPGARPIDDRLGQWISLMNTVAAPVLAVDLPTGLNADTGHADTLCVRAQFTLSLMTLKPGLFTAHGRDASGEVWLDTLDSPGHEPDLSAFQVSACLSGAPMPLPRQHASHKGSYGDVAVIGGAPGMTGAALLAGSAALHFGAGRVFVALLDGGSMVVDANQPELMFRPLDKLDLDAMTAVCGCGGGDAVRHALARVLSSRGPLVLDADAINAIASDSQLQSQLRARASRHLATVLTPHPLEAARLLGATASMLQANRLAAAQQIAELYGCTVVLKGSGTVIAAPGQTAAINPTGNAALATAGTGDILAGMIGARLAAAFSKHHAGKQANEGARDTANHGAGLAFQAAIEAVYLHGKTADDWPRQYHLTASDLVRFL